MGWVTYRHGFRYAQEYGFDGSFEVLVARICANFSEGYKPAKEHCWIAELNGEKVGSVFCVEEAPRVAKLRLLLIEPQARGLGLGRSLVQECVAFARDAGYEKIVLWTNSILYAARSLYEREGFILVKSEAHYSFGQQLTGEIWELLL